MLVESILWSVLYVMHGSNPFVPVWQLTPLGGLSMKIQNPIKSDEQISYVSRGRILINQVRGLHLPARLLVLCPLGARFGKQGEVKALMQWNPVSAVIWHAPGSSTMPCLLFWLSSHISRAAQISSDWALQFLFNSPGFCLRLAALDTMECSVRLLPVLSEAAYKYTESFCISLSLTL